MKFKSIIVRLFVLCALSAVTLGILVGDAALRAQSVNGNSRPLPAPPRVTVNTTWQPPTGNTWVASTAAQFTTVLVQAQPGDTIKLTAGSVFSGNFTLPLKTPLGGSPGLVRRVLQALKLVSTPAPAWIYIESSALAQLPPPGARVGPSNAPNMPTITTPNTTAPIALAPGANHYRLVGLHITSNSTVGGQPGNNPPSNNFTWCLVCWNPAVGLAEPDSITIDRSYLNGSPTQDVGQAIQCNASNCAVIESYISDIHESTFDSQAILVFWSPGPIKIVDNYLSSTTEDVMFGGGGGYNDPYVPSDIQILRNHMFNPLNWESCGVGGTVPAGEQLANGTTCPVGVGNQWDEKNNLEFKSARRVLVSGNLLENSWLSGQTGYGVDMTPRTSQSGNLAVVDDIEFVSNILKDGSGISTLEADNLCGAPWGYPQCTNAGEAKRIWIHDNLMLLRPSLDTYQHGGIKLDGGCSGCGPVNGSLPGSTDLIFQHNTVLMADQSTLWSSVEFPLPQLSWGCSPPVGFSATHSVYIVDNVLTQQPNGDCGLVTTSGIAGLTFYMGDPAPLAPRFFGNVILVPAGSRLNTYPANNDVTQTPLIYVNLSQGNYQLLTPQWTDTTDGKLAGINWAAIQAAQGGVGPTP
jgi:hypothetical protein